MGELRKVVQIREKPIEYRDLELIEEQMRTRPGYPRGGAHLGAEDEGQIERTPIVLEPVDGPRKHATDSDDRVSPLDHGMGSGILRRLSSWLTFSRAPGTQVQKK
jgi:hypothetical protein